MKTIQISAVCSMRDCQAKPIAAMVVASAWISECLKHSKGHGRIDWKKTVAIEQGARRRNQ